MAWTKRRKEISEYRAHKYFKTIAYEWMLAVIKYLDSIEEILLKAINFINFISKSCIKCKRRDRELPFKIFEKISNNISYNALEQGLSA